MINVDLLFRKPPTFWKPGYFGQLYIMLPKTKDASHTQQYQMISLLSVKSKIFMKVTTYRLNGVVEHMVRPTQQFSCKDILNCFGIFLSLRLGITSVLYNFALCRRDLSHVCASVECVHLSYAVAGCVCLLWVYPSMLHCESIKTPFVEEKKNT